MPALIQKKFFRRAPAASCGDPSAMLDILNGGIPFDFCQKGRASGFA